MERLQNSLRAKSLMTASKVQSKSKPINRPLESMIGLPAITTNMPIDQTKEMFPSY